MSETADKVFSIYFENGVPFIKILASQCQPSAPFRVGDTYAHTFRTFMKIADEEDVELIERMNKSPEIIAKLNFGKNKVETVLKFNRIKYSKTGVGADKILGYTLYADKPYEVVLDIQNYV